MSKPNILNIPPDISHDFKSFENTYFMASEVKGFDSKTKTGNITWKRHIRKSRIAFNQMTSPFEQSAIWEFPPEYQENPSLPFSVSFLSKRTIRLQVSANGSLCETIPSLMIDKIINEDNSWIHESLEECDFYKGRFGSVTINHSPFRIEIRDKDNHIVTKTNNMDETMCMQNDKPLPFSYVRRACDLKKYMAASFSLSYDEKIFGCGESFTRLNKRGQKINLWAKDPLSVQTKDMYKPIPFFMSSRGYGMFVHTSVPMTFDFGHSYDEANVMSVGDDQLDLFIFLGNPKEILSEYTKLTGRSSMPPLWSFGLWMSRITYDSEQQVRDIAKKLRDYKIPCDVIHLDTGWFETDWRCNYKFSDSRFDDTHKMISDLNLQGFNISLWQLPYFSPNNELYKEAVDNGFAVTDADGKLPTEDAIIDFSNRDAVDWYKGLLKKLFDIGIGAIKADFGESAPLTGRYISGKSGTYEHNLYPLRYNKAVAEVTKEMTGENIIWARSAWAGSQRYPIHWGGDAENTDNAMAATLRAGLSLGLCGFSFWSHDIGGFVKESLKELYRRWLPFGMLTSHSRCHGNPPTEPWEYDEDFVDDFRESVELKYKLMPYILKQAEISTQNGYPMIRTLFFEFPEDNTSWFIEDEYMFGADILVAPLMKQNQTQRHVYLPIGNWVDYQTGREYQGGMWYTVEADKIPIIIMVKKGAEIPHTSLAQSTNDMNLSKTYKVKY